MEPRYRISVIIPSYNPGAFLREAVGSVLRQVGHFQAQEIIVVDDRSDDAVTLAIYREIECIDTVRVIANSGPKGSAGARNAGLRAAAGDWIAFLDAGDILTPRSFKARCEALDLFPGSGWVGGDYFYMDEDGTPQEESYFRSRPRPARIMRHALEQNSPIKLERPVREFISTGIVNSGSNIIKKHIIEEVGFFDETLIRSQDVHWLTRLALVSDLIFTPATVLMVRQHERNMTLRRESPPNVWRIRAFMKLLEDRSFAPYKSEIFATISRWHLGDCYYYRINKMKLKALSSSVKSLYFNSRNPGAWRCLAASLLGR